MKFLAVALSMFLAVSVSAPDPVRAAEEGAAALKDEAASYKTFNVYADKNSPDNHYIPSGYMGDNQTVSVIGRVVKLVEDSMDNPRSGTTCVKVSYAPENEGWAGVYWQNPANNWGTKKGGFDLTGMTQLTFWARGEKGGEIIQKFVVGGIKGLYPDSATVESGPIELTNTWKEYAINLAGRDLTSIAGGFCWVANTDLSPNGVVFYLDDIKYVADPNIKPQTRNKEVMPFYVYTDKSSLNNHFVPSGYMGDYSSEDVMLVNDSRENPYLGDTCIKVVYSNKATKGQRWVGVYWLNPANNWGTIDAGFDLSNATKLTFWARGEKGTERIEEFKVGGVSNEYSDSDVAGIGPVMLSTEWKQYTIDLKGKDLSYILGGFVWSTNLDVNPEGATFYLDEIKYE
ncbi:MAG: hypothetical protein PHR44_08040 [Candidatus Omnitrophica bacterium]|nr:hypothetical protein [Candidatus Omnitrophota bacterium]